MTIIGVPREVKSDEYRVGLTPAAVRELCDHGHDVVVEQSAGAGFGVQDAAFAAQGATIVPDANTLYGQAGVIVKVKEPQPSEVRLLRPKQILLTYLHLAPDPSLTASLMESGATCIAYETVTDKQGGLPLLAPMSEVAGKIAAQAGGFMMTRAGGGKGILAGGVAGVPPARVLVIGGGVVGLNAARVAAGLGADVTIFDRSVERLRELDLIFDGAVGTQFASSLAIEETLSDADLVIGAVLVRGARAPHVLRRVDLERMQAGSVVVDVAIDQGGSFETSRPTSHTSPTFVVDGVVHYCVANMPGAVPVTATHALVNATLPYVRRIADDGINALRTDPGLLQGLNVVGGWLTEPAVARDQGRSWVQAADAVDRLAA